MSTININKMKVNGLTFTVRTAGLNNSGNLVILLHGFPESSLMWAPLMIKLAEQGYRVAAPDQRGYSKSARPKGYQNYQMKLLSSDIIEIAKKIGFDSKFHLVGHDIGAVVGWTVATLYPEFLKSWTALSVPDWSAYLWALNNDPVQKKKGSYVHLFQHKFVPELILRHSHYKTLKDLWEGFPESTIHAYTELFSQKGALTGAVNWYRALLQLPQIEYSPVKVPTKFIWGNQDLAIARGGVNKNKAYVSGPYQFAELNAGHWFMEFNQDEISNQIFSHIKKYDD
ncbi:alpha/beta fold hydrolase [Pediococcus acidilactici]|uniref:alpha/beta fold hydrolase n=1 Tax=Pediococcus acidilactici TaxID=1254 RepID=UPI001869FC4E|nr:alpha/beta hydrolase [Pediococcus acidilactici]QOP72782.1 alpha/beta hydrolase [Pediococcus acidilactici]